MTFGNYLRHTRQQAGISLRKLAARLEGCSPTYLSKIENDHYAPPSERLIRAMARELGADADDLLARAGKAPGELVALLVEDAGLRRFLRSEMVRPAGERAWESENR